jgi:hypothetical protein
MSLLFAIVTWMTVLAPNRNHVENATAIARVALDEKPLFKGDESRVKTAALLVAISFRESSFHNDAKSKTNDHCMMQINKRPELAEDPVKCVQVAMTMLRESFRMCPEYPIAFYASGPGACTNLRAQRISRDRMALAKRIAGE